ncbi:hypothetical protein E8E15_005568 [Penicillium rubens]|nr:hypothetical protein E8E15_005568 [Penicillium rubens]
MSLSADLVSTRGELCFSRRHIQVQIRRPASSSRCSYIIPKMVGKWLVHHDPEHYAHENYGKCAEHLLSGAPFENTNAVPGYKYKPWTVQEPLDASETGRPVQDEGDWS